MRTVFLFISGLVCFLTIVFIPKALAASRYPFLVVLDAGHGGTDTGTVQYKKKKIFFEKNFSLIIAKKTAAVLRKKGIPVVLTRTKDSDLSLDSRISIANTWGKKADQALFISIHANSNQEQKVSGLETYVFKAVSNEASERLANIENGHKVVTDGTLDLILTDLVTTANYPDSVRLACSVQNEIAKGLSKKGYKIKNRGVKEALFYVLMKTNMPAILLEAGFATNPTDFSWLNQEKYHDAVSLEISSAVLKWKGGLENHRLSGTGKTGNLSQSHVASAVLKNKHSKGSRGLCSSMY